MKLLRLTLIVAALALFAAACATEPEEPEEIPEVDETLQNDATELRDTILQYRLNEYEPEEYDSGQAEFDAATASLVDDPESAGENFRRAIGHFTNVINRGFPALLEDRESEVEVIRSDALDARADVAVASEFNSADEQLQRAITLREDASYEQSFAAFADAEQAFEAARDDAIALRERARAAMDRADQRLQESEERARELEEEIDELDDESDDA